MKTRKPYRIIGFIVLIALLSPGLASAVEFSQDELERLQAGKIVRKMLSNSRQDGFYGGTGFIIVDATSDVVWKALKDFEAYPNMFPRTTETKEVGRKGERSLVKFGLGYKILSVGYYLNVVHDQENKKITFNMVSSKPHDIENTSGYWRLFPQPDGRTLVAYAVSVQVPKGIVLFLGDSLEDKLERNLVGLPKYLKAWVESPSGSRYRTMTAKK